MRSKIGIMILAAVMIFSLAGLASAAQSKSVTATVVIPLTTSFSIETRKYIGDDKTGIVSGSMDFGILTFNTTYKIFTPACYYGVLVGVQDNSGTAWTVTHTRTAIQKDASNHLNNNINVSFMAVNPDNTEDVLSKVSYANSNNVPFSKASLTGHWLKIYYGVASGVGDNTGVVPIDITYPQGTYTGTVTLTLTP